MVAEFWRKALRFQDSPMYRGPGVEEGNRLVPPEESSTPAVTLLLWEDAAMPRNFPTRFS